MIRKPQAEDFREGAAVTALRESKKVAVEGSKGVGQGVAKAYSYWFGGIMLFGFAMSALSALGGPGGLWLLGIGGFLFVVYRHDRNKQTPLSANPIIRAFSKPAPGDEDRAPAQVEPATAGRRVSQHGQHHLDVASLVQQIVLLAGSALLLILFANVGLRTPFMLAGIAMLALAVLLIARLFSDRVVLRYDNRSLTVTGLLGSHEMLWADAEDVGVRVTSRFNVKVLFTSGARRNLVITAARNSLGGPTELFVPVDLLGLEKDELVGLVTNLLCCRAAGGAEVPSWQTEQSVPPPRPALSPASDPRSSFDPDAIMARHLAERERLVAEQRPANPQTNANRRTFGRKAF